jgi:hypothetical protein
MPRRHIAADRDILLIRDRKITDKLGAVIFIASSSKKLPASPLASIIALPLASSYGPSEFFDRATLML